MKHAFVLTLLVFLSGLTTAQTAWAVTRAQFSGPFGTIRILARDFAGNLDSDGQNLYEAMNVPVQNSILGLGKAIESSDKGLQLICAYRTQVGHECVIFIHTSEFAIVDPVQKIMRYKITGDKADEYGKLFPRDSRGVYFYSTRENSFTIYVAPGVFHVSYAETPAQTTSNQKLKLRHSDTQTLVVVNVADVLKLSHVQNFWDSLNYAKDLRQRFIGMKNVLSQLDSDNRGFHFVYLAQSPELESGKVEMEFLRKFNFPQGELKTYSSESAKEDRLKILEDLIQAHTPKQVILISHNGGVDPEVFHNLFVANPGISILPYIHVVYSTSSSSELGSVLYPEQTGYVTSVELMADWQMRGFVDYTRSVELAQLLIPKILNEKLDTPGLSEFAVPYFANCDDFLWNWSVDGNNEYLVPLHDYLKVRCHLR